jgi:hypothetical protein
MALGAVLHEQRPHLRLEEFEVGRLMHHRRGQNRFCGCCGRCCRSCCFDRYRERLG